MVEYVKILMLWGKNIDKILLERGSVVDRIKKQKSRNFITILSYALLLFNAFAGFCSIYGLFFTVTGKNLYTLVIVFSAISSLIGIATVLEEKKRKSDERILELTEGFHTMCHNIRDEIADIDSSFDTVEDEKELNKAITLISKRIVDKLSDILAATTGCKIRACIKYFDKCYYEADISKMKIVTLCRSNMSVHDSIHEQKEKININNNTDFKYIVCKKGSYFAHGNLQKFKKSKKDDEYENSNNDWKKLYNATIVCPIRLLVDNEENDYYDLIGFLCVDTKNVKAFQGEIGDVCVDFVKAVSDILYVFYNKCLEYKDIIQMGESAS